MFSCYPDSRPLVGKRTIHYSTWLERGDSGRCLDALFYHHQKTRRVCRVADPSERRWWRMLNWEQQDRTANKCVIFHATMAPNNRATSRYNSEAKTLNSGQSIPSHRVVITVIRSCHTAHLSIQIERVTGEKEGLSCLHKRFKTATVHVTTRYQSAIKFAEK